MQYSNQGVPDGQTPNSSVLVTSADWYGSEPSVDRKSLLCLLEGLAALDGRMRMLLLRDGTFLAGCPGLSELFSMGTCLHLHDGIIRAAQPEYSDRLDKLLQVRAPEVGTLALPCWKMNGHLIIRATSIGKSVVCFSLQRATEMAEPKLADLEEVFNLTKAEAVIVYDLFSGRTPQQIAADHDNSVHTVRAHIRRCYDKLGISCREELWRKLNAYRLT